MQPAPPCATTTHFPKCAIMGGDPTRPCPLSPKGDLRGGLRRATLPIFFENGEGEPAAAAAPFGYTLRVRCASRGMLLPPGVLRDARDASPAPLKRGPMGGQKLGGVRKPAPSKRGRCPLRTLRVCCPLRCDPPPPGMLREGCYATRGMIRVVLALYFPEVIAILITDFTPLIDCSLFA
jgi:hypothetical protein